MPTCTRLSKGYLTLLPFRVEDRVGCAGVLTLESSRDKNQQALISIHPVSSYYTVLLYFPCSFAPSQLLRCLGSATKANLQRTLPLTQHRVFTKLVRVAVLVKHGSQLASALSTKVSRT
jgi:hypothetical protein